MLTNCNGGGQEEKCEPDYCEPDYNEAIFLSTVNTDGHLSAVMFHLYARGPICFPVQAEDVMAWAGCCAITSHVLHHTSYFRVYFPGVYPVALRNE